MVSQVERIQSGIRKRWVHAESNQRILHLAEEIAQHEPSGQSIAPVVFFNASTRLEALSLNAGFSLLMSWMVRLAGVPVVNFVCQAGLKPCVLGTQRADFHQEPPCSRCRAQSAAVYADSQTVPFEYLANKDLEQRLTGLDLNQLEDFEANGIPFGKLVLPSARWILRRFHLQDNENTRFLLRQYILSAASLAEQFTKLLKETSPQAVVVFNGMLYPEATARWIAQKKGIRVISHEVGLQPLTGFFTDGDATAYPIEVPEDFQLNDEQTQKLDAYLEHRFQGNFSMAGIRFWPEIRSLGDEFWAKAEQFKQVVPVFTNVIFDTSQSTANVLFETMFAWLDEVQLLAKNHPETLFVIRAHPDENRPGKESSESVAEWVKTSAVSQLPNVHFVGADEYFSSYELIERSKFVMIYNSTIGLEASLIGRPVLCAGRARFTQMPIVFFPTTRAEYLQTAEEFLSVEKVEVPFEFRENARRFLYYQLYRASLPFSEYLEDDGVWQGYVRLKKFNWQQLSTDHSKLAETLVKGILKDQAFLFDV
jgi:hypothetical protein